MSGATAATAGTGEPRESLNARHRNPSGNIACRGVVGPTF